MTLWWADDDGADDDEEDADDDVDADKHDDGDDDGDDDEDGDNDGDDDDDGDGDDDDDADDDDGDDDDDVEKEEDEDVEGDNVEGDVDKDDNVAEDGVDDHDVAEDKVEDDDGEDEDVKGEEDDVDVEEEEDDDVEEDDVEEEDRSQDREAHFVRAYAGDMRMDISQEPFCMQIYRKNGRGHFRGHRFVRACAVEIHMDMSRRHFVRKLTVKMWYADPATSVLCVPAQSKCKAFCAEIYSENAVRVSRDQCFVRACAVEMHMDMSQEAHCGNLQGKYGRFRYHLDWTPALNCYRKNPSVWPHCLGKKGKPKSTIVSCRCLSLWIQQYFPRYLAHLGPPVIIP